MLGRVMKLERTLPMTDDQRAALIVVHGSDHNPDDICAVHGIDLQRLPGELAQQFLGRVESHVRATRGKNIPLVTFAIYRDDVAE